MLSLKLLEGLHWGVESDLYPALPLFEEPMGCDRLRRVKEIEGARAEFYYRVALPFRARDRTKRMTIVR